MGATWTKLDHVVEELRHEDLRYIELGDEVIGDSGALRLAEALAASKCVIASLDVHGCELSDFGFGAICEAIVANAANGSKLEKLDCSFNKLTNDGAHSIAALLLRHSLTRLAVVDVGSNALGDDGAIAIADALPFNRALATLKLWNNAIDARGCAALSGIFCDDASGCVLVELALMGNPGFSNAVRADCAAARKRRRMSEGGRIGTSREPGVEVPPASLIAAAVGLGLREGEPTEAAAHNPMVCRTCSVSAIGGGGASGSFACAVDLDRGAVLLDAPAWAGLRARFGAGTLEAHLVVTTPRALDGAADDEKSALLAGDVR
jgi:hypothetical protein